MRLWPKRHSPEPERPISARQRREDARFDAFVANAEHYGRCLDCEAGEPHACQKEHNRATHLLRLATNARAAYDAMHEGIQ